MKQILVPCDFSKEATEAYKFALELAKRADLDILVIYTIDLPIMVAGFDVMPYSFDPALQKELKDAATSSFNEMTRTVGTSHRVRFEVKFSSLMYAVELLTDGGNIELIVMGTKGVSGIDEILFGSNTEKIVRFSTVPVFAIRRTPAIEAIKTIIFPNRMTLDQTSLVKRVVDLQEFFDAHLHLLWVNTPGHFVPDSEIQGQMKEFVHHYGLRNYSLVIRNDINEETGVVRYSREIGNAVIAMGTSGKRGIAHLFEGSIAEDVVNHTTNPIWTFSTRKSSK